MDTIPCRIYLISEDPDGLKGINQEKMAKAQQKRYPIAKPYRDAIENKYQWCIAAVPGKEWAKKLFPELRPAAAVEKLWENILATSRVDDDPIAAWETHNKDPRPLRLPQQPAYREAPLHQRHRHRFHRGHDPGGTLLRRQRKEPAGHRL